MPENDLIQPHFRKLRELGYRNILPDALKDRPEVVAKLAHLVNSHEMKPAFFSADTDGLRAVPFDDGQFVISRNILALLNDEELTALLAQGLEAKLNELNKTKPRENRMVSGAVGGAILGAIYAGISEIRSKKNPAPTEETPVNRDKMPSEVQPSDASAVLQQDVDSYNRREFIETAIEKIKPVVLGTATGGVIGKKVAIPLQPITLDFDRQKLADVIKKSEQWYRDHPNIAPPIGRDIRRMDPPRERN